MMSHENSDDDKDSQQPLDLTASYSASVDPAATQAGNFSNCDIHDSADAASNHEPSPSSRTIGPYKLLQVLGEGGMGTVWMAEQEKPVRRRVALKLIKAGVDNKQVIARFEAERQALAMMDHQNIARVLDAGNTSYHHGTPPKKDTNTMRNIQTKSRHQQSRKADRCAEKHRPIPNRQTLV